MVSNMIIEIEVEVTLLDTFSGHRKFNVYRFQTKEQYENSKAFTFKVGDVKKGVEVKDKKVVMIRI